MKEKYPLKKLWQVYFKNWKMARFLNIDQLPVERMQELEWLVQARLNLEQPINLPATGYSDLNYGIILYNKTAMAFNYLRLTSEIRFLMLPCVNITTTGCSGIPGQMICAPNLKTLQTKI
jgi:hypothetical protein